MDGRDVDKGLSEELPINFENEAGKNRAVEGCEAAREDEIWDCDAKLD